LSDWHDALPYSQAGAQMVPLPSAPGARAAADLRLFPMGGLVGNLHYQPLHFRTLAKIKLGRTPRN
jgi:hypothetical protein